MNIEKDDGRNIMDGRSIVTAFIITVIIASLIIPIIHWINISVGNEAFMNFFTWGEFHIHLGLFGIIALIFGGILGVYLFIKGERSNMILLCVFLVLFGIIAVVFDYKDVVSGTVWSGMRI